MTTRIADGLMMVAAELHELNKALTRIDARLADIEMRLPPKPTDAPISDDLAAFGERVRAYRKKHGYTLRTMASITKVSATTLSRIERGIANFEQDTWHRVAGVINQEAE